MGSAAGKDCQTALYCNQAQCEATPDKSYKRCVWTSEPDCDTGSSQSVNSDGTCDEGMQLATHTDEYVWSHIYHPADPFSGNGPYYTWECASMCTSYTLDAPTYYRCVNNTCVLAEVGTPYESACEDICGQSV